MRFQITVTLTAILECEAESEAWAEAERVSEVLERENRTVRCTTLYRVEEVSASA